MITSRKLYDDDLAQQLKTCAGQKYRPSNGTEGEIFIANWCGDCVWNTDVDCTKHSIDINAPLRCDKTPDLFPK